MPSFFQNYLDRYDLKFHFIRALYWGLGLRLITAYFVYGPQALDDYKHGVIPAYELFKGLSTSLPDYRSPLLNWVLSAWLHIGSFLGMESGLSQVRWMYALLGVISLSAIIGAYLYAKNYPNERFGKIFVYFCSLHALMPFVGTRAFGESVALGLVLLGLGIIEQARHSERKRDGLIGFWILGLAVLFRFHVGLIYVPLLLIFLIERNWRLAMWGGVAGVITLVQQIGIDLLAGKPALGTLTVYLAENQGGGAKYGVMPWYNTWLLVLALAFVPFSLVFVPKLKQMWLRHWRVVVPFLIFVTAHSLAAHKEERFMYPIVGIVFLILSDLWASQFDSGWVRRFFAPIVLTLNFIALPLACLNNTQVGEIEPLAIPESRFERILYLDAESLVSQSRIKEYFLRPPSRIKKVETEQINSFLIDDELRADPQWQALVLVTSQERFQPYLESLEKLETELAQCGRVQAASSLIDSLIYRMNPKHNQRRRPTWYVICRRVKES